MNEKLKYALVFLGGAGVGGGVTYLVVRNRMRAYYAKFATEEIESVKDTYALLRGEPPYDNAETATKAYLDRIDNLQYMAEHPEEAELELDPVDPFVRDEEGEIVRPTYEAYEDDIPEDAVEITVPADEEPVELFVQSPERKAVDYGKAFVQKIMEPEEEPEETEEPDASWKTVSVFDQPEEVVEMLTVRSEDDPYLISVEEFMEEDDLNHSKITITYYEADDQLADDQDGLINDVVSIVGEENLEKFGHRSNDKNIVYVRNERLGADFEVVKDERAFQEAVLGVTDWENRGGSPRHKVLKMRADD